jgi:hypothetical protein
MGLTFLHPAFLLGALATAVPIVIHLIYRRRALVHRFPAVRFLLLADKRTARKFRIHQWLLLLLRVLAILLLALILARPRLVGEAAHAAAVLPAQAMIIMVDNSLSMHYRDGQESRLQRAKVLAGRLLQGLRQQDSVAVFPLLPSEAESGETAFFSNDVVTLRDHIAAIEASHAAVDMTAAFQRAFTLLQGATATRRRIVLLADFTVHGWEDFHLSRLAVVPEQVELHFVRLGSAQRDANLLVEGVRIVEKPFIEHTPLDVSVLIRNRSAASVRNLRVDLWLEHTKIGEQLVDLAPDEQVTVPFRMMAPAAGVHWGEVRLESDLFADDDRWYYALRTVAPVRVLVVDGDPGTSLYDSEIFYLLSALQPAGTLRRPLFYPKPVPWEGLEQERLNEYQIVLLCNLEAIGPQLRRRLYQFVVDGGGVIFFAGDRVDASRYNAMFYHSDTPLLPLPLAAPAASPPDQALSIGSIHSAHEALTVFAAEEALLQRSKFYRTMPMSHQPEMTNVQTLLTLQHGAILLADKPLGRGRVLFFATSADRDWTDLPTRTAYVPLLHGILGYVANLAAAAQRPATTMPTPVLLPGQTADLDTAVTLFTPDGHERHSRYTTDGTQVVARFAAYTIPGIYRLQGPGGRDFLAVNATRTESNLEKLQFADLRTKFQPLSLHLEEESTLDRAADSNPLPMKELSAIFMLAFVTVLMAENVYANRF